ncbi:MAG: glycosyltransferase N-terminal domain-containing protein [Bacteroidota bacterium]|nr:glycosyltransferase N-terminal domain-containing protein [Bacteroidota bacterium]
MPGKIFYLLSTQAYFLIVKLFAPFNKRAQLLYHGQKGLLKKFEDFAKGNAKKSIWFHVASLGEFEQGRPIMEALKKEYPECKLVVTFFSPSGYESRKNDPICEATFYLPFESKINAERVVKYLNPKLAIWIKYDFWFAYLHELKNKNIPLYLCAAQFRKNQLFFKPFGNFHRQILKQFTYIFCQNENSKSLLNSIGITNCSVSGDNRYDRVYESLQQAAHLPIIEKFKGTDFLLIAGSSYELEESFLEFAFSTLNKSFKIIFAPHFVEAKQIHLIETRFGMECIKYSECTIETNFTDKKVLIIDSIGLLAKAYRYGDAAFIGGGFEENGLHNTLEAATFGMPICFGPKIKRFPEAAELIHEDVASIVLNKTELSIWITKFLDDKNYQKNIAQKSREFIARNIGATEKVVKYIITSSTSSPAQHPDNF